MMSYGFGVLVTLKSWMPPAILMLFTQVFIAFPVVYSIVSLGVEEINPEYREVAATLGSTESEITRRIYLPCSGQRCSRLLPTVWPFLWAI